jgi:hypothetical protein
MARPPRSKTVEVEVNVGFIDVEVDLADIDTEDLIAELRSRDVNSFVTSPELDDIYKQFSFGNESRAIELTKKYIENTTGRILS